MSGSSCPPRDRVTEPQFSKDSRPNYLVRSGKLRTGGPCDSAESFPKLRAAEDADKAPVNLVFR
jgi:hypothetical protein